MYFVKAFYILFINDNQSVLCINLGFNPDEISWKSKLNHECLILLIYWLHNRVKSSNQSSIKEILQSTRCSLICKTRGKNIEHFLQFIWYFSFNNLFIWDQILIKTKKIISHFKIYWGQKFKNEPIWLVQTIYFNLHELAHTYALVADFFISFTTGKMVSRTSSRVFNNHRLINLHHFCCCPLKKKYTV